MEFEDQGVSAAVLSVGFVLNDLLEIEIENASEPIESAVGDSCFPTPPSSMSRTVSIGTTRTFRFSLLIALT